MTATLYAREDFTVGAVRSLAYLNFRHVDTAGLAKTYRWAGTVLPNVGGYLGGPAEARVCMFGYYDRGLSSDSGQLQVSTLTITLSDWDYTLRGFLGRPRQFGLLEVEVDVWTITEADWRLGRDPIPYYRGIVADYTPAADRLFALQLKDVLATRAASEFPLVALRDYFTELPGVAIGKYAPILLGTKSDEGAPDPPPTLIAEPDHFSSFIDGAYAAGYGHLGGAVPTGLTVTELPGTGSLPAGRYYVRATTVDTTGQESDPDTFIDTQGIWINVSANAAIRVTCANMGTPKYRFYIGQLFFGVRWHHYLEVSTPTATFTAYGDRLDTITPGGAFCFASHYWYVGWAVMADGRRTSPTLVVDATNFGYRRPLRFAMTTVPGAIAYGAARRTGVGDYTREWEIAPTHTTPAGYIYFEDDQLDLSGTLIAGLPKAQGTIPAIPIGGPYVDHLLRVEWQGFLICYGCGTTIHGLYQGGLRVPNSAFMVGGNWAAPGLGDWNALFGPQKYREFAGGVRMWIFYVRGQDAIDAISGDRPIYVNATGADTAGDGGGTAITNIYEQLRWLLRNWVIGPKVHPEIGGGWLGTQTFNDGAPRLDDDSIDATKADAALVFDVHDGAFYLDTPQTVTAAIAPALQWADAAIGVNANGAAMLVLLPPAPPTVTAVEAIDHVSEILQGSFAVDDSPIDWANRLTYRYDYNERLGDYREQKIANDANAQEVYRRIIQSKNVLELRCGRDAARAAAIAQRAVIRLGRPDRTVSFARAYHAVHRDLGTRLTVTHPDGAGAGGYVDRLLQIRRVSPNHDELRVDVQCWDLEWFKRRSTNTAEVLLREAKMQTSLGGSRHATAYWTGFHIVPHDYRDVRIDWDAFSGVGARFEVSTLVTTNVSEAQVRPTIHDLDAGISVVSAVAVPYNATDVANDTFTTSVMLLAPATGVHRYRLIYLNTATSGPATETLKGFGTCALYEL